MLISFTIMAHPKRSEWVNRLVEQTGITTIVWDTQNDVWETGKRSLLSFNVNAEYHVIIQDDCLPCSNFVNICKSALEYAEGKPVGLYVGKPRPYRHIIEPAISYAYHNGYSWLEMEPMLWGQGMALPTIDIPSIVEWGDSNPVQNRYDMRVSRYYQHQDRRALFTVPSLVDHRREQENPSLIPGHGGDRFAYYWLENPVFNFNSEPYKLETKFLTST